MSQINEGVNDRAIFKCVMIAGGSGSGKDHVVKNTISGLGLVEVNSDHAFEYLMQKTGLSLAMSKEQSSQRDLVRGRAKNITQEKDRLQVAGRKGIIINGTGDSFEKVKAQKQKLTALGYDCMMIFVNVSNEVSQYRNIMRGFRGGRQVPEVIRSQKWHSAQENIARYKSLFGWDKFILFDNSADTRESSEEVRKQWQKRALSVYKRVRKFIEKPVKNKRALAWIDQQRQSLIRENINLNEYSDGEAYDVTYHHEFKDFPSEKVTTQGRIRTKNGKKVIHFNRKHSHTGKDYYLPIEKVGQMTKVKNKQPITHIARKNNNIKRPPKELKENSGAGEEGTDKLVNKYKSVTPGEGKDKYKGKPFKELRKRINVQ